MVFVVGTLLAWAVSLRLISNALFAAVAAYLNIWASVILGLLCLLGLYPPRASHTKQALAASAQDEQHTQQLTQQDVQQQQQSPFTAHAMTHVQLEQAADSHIHSWVQSAALDAAQCSPPGSTCPSTTSPHATPKEPLSQESSSNGSSSTASTGQAVSTAIAKAAAQGMLQAYTMKDTEGKLHAAAPAAVAAWATSYILANRISESSSAASSSALKGRRVSNVCLPPLEYEASAELQQELEAAAPDEFICPIGRVLMVDPVFTPSGFTYHRHCIVDWIQRTGRDPAQDGSPLSPSQLCPNVNLRDQIATWLQRQGVET